MKKNTISMPLPGGKSLDYEFDPQDHNEKQFAERCKQVAAMKPQSIQDFVVQLQKLMDETPLQTDKKAAKFSHKKSPGNRKLG